MSKSKTTWKDNQFIAVLRLGLSFIRHTGIMFCLLGLSAWGIYYVWNDALQNEAYQIKPAHLAENQSLDGMDKDIAEELARLNRVIAGRSIFEPGLLRDLRQAYDASPWIMQTYAFRKELPGAIQVEYKLREPAALAYYSGYYHQVDSEGMVLPRKGVNKPQDNLPVISGNISDMPAKGKKWQNEGLLDALGVIATIKRSTISDQIQIRQAVVRRGSFFDRQLHRQNTRPRIELYTTAGALIKWGTFNRDHNQEDLLSDEKIAMLERVLGQTGELQNGLTLDIRTRSISCSGGSVMR
ncbi:MAG: hypothetical protein JXA52_04600 [Planctomycetes bacterium]|nr:hypothetical protein [Planctomycetota bacterium]